MIFAQTCQETVYDLLGIRLYVRDCSREVYTGMGRHRRLLGMGVVARNLMRLEAMGKNSLELESHYDDQTMLHSAGADSC